MYSKVNLYTIACSDVARGGRWFFRVTGFPWDRREAHRDERAKEEETDMVHKRNQKAHQGQDKTYLEVSCRPERSHLFFEV